METITILENELPKTWEIKKIKDLCKVVNGSTPKTSESSYWNGDILWITPKDLTNFKRVFIYDTARKITKKGYESCSTTLVPKGTVLMSSRAPIGHLAIAGKEICTNQGFKSFICTEKINNKYLYYYLKSIIPVLKYKGSGTTFNELSKTKAENIQVPLPSIETQQKIAQKLDAFFESYNKLKKEKRKAKEKYVKILQSYMFGFLKNKWGKKKLNEICLINPKKKEITDLPGNLDVSFIPMSFVDEKEGVISKQDIRKLKEVRKGYTYFKEKDVLFAKITPCMENGKAAIAKNLKNNIGFGSTEWHVIRGLGNVLPEYIFFIIRQPFFRQEAASKMSGTAGQLRVPVRFLEDYELPLPPINEQKKLVELASKIKKRIVSINKEQKNLSFQLEQLPKSVLSKAFKGELVQA